MLAGATIMGDGSNRIECQTSFCTRLSQAHGWSPTTLIRLIDSVSGRTRYGTHMSAFSDNVRPLNSYGVSQSVFAAALVKLTDITNIVDTSLAALNGTFALNGMGAVKRSRHWCPQCYSEWRRQELDVWDMLIWQMEDLCICPVDLTPLTNCCHSCGSEQPFLPRSGSLDICCKCGCWLGKASAPTPHDASTTAYQRWLANEYSDLLTQRSYFRPRLSGHECAMFVDALGTCRNFSIVDLGKRVQLPFDTLYQWKENRVKPRLVSWARFCANLNVSISSTLIDPVEAAKQLSFPFDSARIYIVTRSAPRKRHSKEAITNAVRQQLEGKRPSVSSVYELADNIGVPISMVYFHAPTDAKKLARRLNTLKKTKSTSQKKSLVRALSRAAVRLDKANSPITRKALTAEVLRKSRSSRHAAKAYFPRAIDLFKRRAPGRFSEDL